MAVQSLFPDVQVTIGPSIADGFYYDFARDKPFTPEDIEKIEAKMHELVKQDVPTHHEIWKRDDAIRHFKDMGEHYKAEIIESIPADQDIKLYFHGDWHDLCRGPHALSLGKVGNGFKLTKLAGAYWRGDAKNQMLQRIYGTAWRDKKELDAYLLRLEEAEKRDHRKLGKEMNLFHLQDEAVGMVFWHPKGFTLWNTLENYIRRKLQKDGYQEIRTPQLIDRSLWEASGHWEKFRENMFTCDVEDRVLALKPMNCPGHLQVFNQGLKSYRDLPLRLAEFGCCHRYEPSGALHGIMRVRGFVQDDAHIICRPDQITEETKKFCTLLAGIYKDLGFESFKVKFSDRPEKRAGTDETWDKSEQALKIAVEQAGYAYTINKGEGAFYGPKLEFVLTDAIGRDWQCGTLQVDFVLPERLHAHYITEEGVKEHPVMLHRAVLGSFERFIGILIEQYAGKFPLWLAPVQVVVATVVSDANDYAEELVKILKNNGIRAEFDLRNEKIGYKIREHALAKTPITLVVGRAEAEEKTVCIRRLGSQDQKTIAFTEFLDSVKKEATPADL
jgi:threonyl-tRNA synthetase